VRTLPAAGTAAASDSGSDRTSRVALGATWAPTRSLLFGCDISRERRSASGVLSLPYHADDAACYGQLTLR
jgi:hypothetical protein